LRELSIRKSLDNVTIKTNLMSLKLLTCYTRSERNLPVINLWDPTEVWKIPIDQHFFKLKVRFVGKNSGIWKMVLFG
jgi:hypothetical protein